MVRTVRALLDGAEHAGILEGDEIRLVPEPGLLPLDIVISEGWDGLTNRATQKVTLDSVRLLAPVPKPGKVIGVGLNYRDHAEEQGLEPPEKPILFPINSTAVISPGDPIPLHSELTSKVDYEAELAVVIGRPAFNVTEAQALDYVAGYTAINDVSARDLQRSDRHWIKAKGLDGFAPLGPTLVSPDTIDPFDTPVQGIVNGELRQNSTTANLVFSVPYLIAYCSAGVTLRPGDIIATGTPGGVGVFMDPPRFLEAGDMVTVRIPGIGDLTNPVEN